VPKTKNEAAERVKKLAREYARAYAEHTWIGSRDADEHKGIQSELTRTRRALHTAIDELAAGELVAHEPVAYGPHRWLQQYTEEGP
jgi:hypothetical protein